MKVDKENIYRTIREELGREWESLRISDDFMFGRVMRSPELCRGMLERIFPRLKANPIEYLEHQKSIDLSKDAKGIRLDVYLKTPGKVFDIEMQTVRKPHLPQRARYYNSVITLDLLDKGQDYDEMDDCFVVFICLEDPFGRGLYQYPFEHKCQLDNTLNMDDGGHTVFLNAAGTEGVISPDLRAFLDYVAGKPVQGDPYIDSLEQAVREARQNREWRHQYMIYKLWEMDKLEEGREEGLKEGREESMKKVTYRMMQMGKPDAEIAEITDLPLQQIKELRKQLHLQEA